MDWDLRKYGMVPIKGQREIKTKGGDLIKVKDTAARSFPEFIVGKFGKKD
jgi:hypothetical protein